MCWRTSDLVDRLASDQRTGLIFVDEYGHRRDYTFAEIATHSQRYAAALRAFGVRQGDRVYLCLSTTGKCIFTMLALQRIEAQVVLGEHNTGSASTVIADRKYRASIDEARERFSPDARYVLIGEEREGWARLDTLAQVASADIAAPAQVDETALRQARDQAYEQLGAVATDVVWCALQVEDPDWFERAIAQPWLSGSTAVVHNRAFDARERLDLVRELDVTILLQRVDEYHAELAVPDPKRFKMPRLRRCLVLDDGSDDLLQTQWAERFGVQLTPAGDQSPQKT